MYRTRLVFSVAVSWLLGCVAPPDDAVAAQDASDRDRGLDRLQRAAGGPVALEVGANGATRVLAMAPQHHVPVPGPGRAGDPAAAAVQFLARHHDAFGLDADEVASFAVTRIDVDPSGIRHVILQRRYQGDPVFQGAISVHLDAENGVFRALGDSGYRIARPANQRVLTPEQAARAAGRALGLADLGPVVASGDAQRTVLTSPRTLDPIDVAPRIFQVAPDDHRFAYQATLSWLDDRRQQHCQLVIVDAATGAALAIHDLVDAFTGRVFTASPGAAPTSDGRTVVSFDGDPAASPSGWVGSARTTTGNNAVAATDLDHNNLVGTSEVQPIADASDAFDFPFSPAEDPAGFREAAVASAFYLVNDWHDRTYRLGFTETAGNFQSSNFGKGGAQNDEVQVDVQDGAGVSNANFATLPDGLRPRMQLFLFDLENGSGGIEQDSAFDPTVIYHEHTHGLSNRLVGGGTTGCLTGVQSSAMGEGWSDFMAASFLDAPVIGAYVTGNATVGIRLASMASSGFTFGNLQDGSLRESHDAGEIWAATLWDVRTALGAAITEQLVVSGMKLTPCRPTMLQARDAIIAADASANAGAHRCALYAAFAGRLMGSSASSPTDNATSAVVTSTEVPADCGDPIPPTGATRTFTSTDVPRAIPDNDPHGVASAIHTRPKGFVVQKVLVTASITHTYRGDLVVQVISPDGQTVTLTDRAGGSADNFAVAGLDITSSLAAGTPASGTWKLSVRDVAIGDTGEITDFRLAITASRAAPAASGP
jgi:subtilisin-like proprotein convertase family protein